MRHVPRSLAAVVLAGLAIAGAACSSPSKQVTTKIQQALQSSLHLPDKPTTVCPSGAHGLKGETFTCTVTIDGQKLDAHVDFTRNNNFDLTYDGTVPTAKELEAKVKSDITATSVDCGRTPLLVITPTHPVVCTATGGQGVTRKIQVGYKDNKLDYTPIDG
ncbi:MAG: hypothetical protein JWN46_2818 [Acidimicrobiales bacterium]|nr:hypothetical protein [Acidimicrobiales bacterium]